MPAPFTRICTIPTTVKAAIGDGGAVFVEGIASSGKLDRHGEVVNQTALLRAFKASKGLPYLWQHDHTRPIGKVVEYGMHGENIQTRSQILPPERNQSTRELVDLLELGVPMSQSIGFNPIGGFWSDWQKSGDEDEDGVWHWGGVDGSKDFDLVELSAVTIGANPDADLAMAKSLGIEYDRPWLRKPDERIVAGVALADLTDPEELRFFDDLDAALKRMIGMANITRHWAKEGRALSPETLDALVSPITTLAEFVKAGRVLSDKNRTAVIAARDALNEVITRDDESASRKPSETEGEEDGDKAASGLFESAWYGR